jgi:hypothetical protein
MSDSREGKAKVKPEATRTAEENKLVNNLMRDLYSVYTENDPDLDLEVNAVWDLLVGFEADVLASAVTPKGYKLVSIKPTLDMIDAAHESGYIDNYEAKITWELMVAAAQEPSKQDPAE